MKPGNVRSTIKNIVIYLRLSAACHRRRLMGIFRFWGASAGWAPLIFTDEESFRIFLASKNFLANNIQGIIAAMPRLDSTRKLITASDIPFVGLGFPDEMISARRVPVAFVHNDNEAIGQAAADCFARIGRFRSYLYFPDTFETPWSIKRGESFMRSLHRSGLDCRVYTHDPKEEDNDLNNMTKFLKAAEKPAAAFVAWDGRAVDVLHAAARAGLSVPNDVSVLGVDNDDLLCEHSSPPLSSIKTDAEGTGYAAAAELDRLIRGKRMKRSRIICCPIQGIVERESTRPPTPLTTTVERALTFIDTRATAGIKPNDVARYLRISRRQLDSAFNRCGVGTVAAKISERKLSEAKKRLQETNLPVKEVFLASGFRNIVYANRLFKKTFGLTPTVWRRSHANITMSDTTCGNPDSRNGFERLRRISPEDAKCLRALS